MTKFKLNEEQIEIKDARLSQVIDDLDSELFNILDSTVYDPTTYAETTYRVILRSIDKNGGIPNYDNLGIAIALIQRLPNIFQIGRNNLIKGLKGYDEILEETTENMVESKNYIEELEKQNEEMAEIMNQLKEENMSLKASMYVIEDKIKLARLEEQNKNMREFYEKEIVKPSKEEDVIIDEEKEVEDIDEYKFN